MLNDPLAVSGDTRIHAGISRQGATSAPRYDADLERAPIYENEDGPSAVALARIHASDVDAACTEHVREDLIPAVLLVAYRVGDDRHINLACVSGPARYASNSAVTIAHGCGAPARHSRHSARSCEP